MTEQRREAEALREREREAALRAWLHETAPDAVPPSLARTVASVTSRPHPAGARRERGAFAWLPGPASRSFAPSPPWLRSPS